MAAVHRPDFQAFRKESGPARQAGTRYQEHFKWPYINKEDLAKPKTLLLLLNSRGRHPPSAFAAADTDAMLFAQLSRQAQELQSLPSKYEGKLSPSKDLPSDYMRALLKFR